MFSNGTLRISSVEVYDGLVYGCEARTQAGRLAAHARVYVLGEQNLSADVCVLVSAGSWCSVWVCVLVSAGSWCSVCVCWFLV